MKRSLLFGVLFLLGTMAFCQKSYQVIENEICRSLENVDFTKSKTELRELLVSVTNKAYLKFPQHLEKIKAEVKKNKPFASEQEISTIIGVKVSLGLLESCDNYVKISQQTANIKMYPEKTSLKIIGNKMCDLLNRNRSKSYQELDQIVQDNLFSFILENETQVKKDYRGGLENPDFSGHLNAYLMLNCALYYKMNLIVFGQ